MYLMAGFMKWRGAKMEGFLAPASRKGGGIAQRVAEAMFTFRPPPLVPLLNFFPRTP